MLQINYSKINQKIDELLQDKKFKNQSHLMTAIAKDMGMSMQSVWRMIIKKDINTFSQLNKLSSALGVPVIELFIITDEPKEDYVPIAQIH